MRIIRERNILPKTDYAPTFNIPIGVAKFDEEKTGVIKKFLLNKEKELINTLPSTHTAGTDLKEDSITNKFGSYNLFDFKDECKELNDLFLFLQESYIKFIILDGQRFIDVEIVCWFNILRKGEDISIHHHSAGNYSEGYLSGNIHLDSYNTITKYLCPYDIQTVYPVKNLIGGLTLFPSWMLHGSDKHLEDKERVSIAFDLRPTSLNQDQFKKLHGIEFIRKDKIKNI